MFAALDQRIATRFAIKPMDLAESAAYLRHHLTLAGRDEPLFADDAVARLHRVANGLPRALNNAATAALIAAAAAGKDLVDDACAKKAVAELTRRLTAAPRARQSYPALAQADHHHTTAVTRAAALRWWRAGYQAGHGRPPSTSTKPWPTGTGSSPASTPSAPPTSKPNSTRCCSRPSTALASLFSGPTTPAVAQPDRRRQQRSPPRPARTSTPNAASSCANSLAANNGRGGAAGQRGVPAGPGRRQVGPGPVREDPRPDRQGRPRVRPPRADGPAHQQRAGDPGVVRAGRVGALRRRPHAAGGAAAALRAQEPRRDLRPGRRTRRCGPRSPAPPRLTCRTGGDGSPRISCGTTAPASCMRTGWTWPRSRRSSAIPGSSPP